MWPISVGIKSTLEIAITEPGIFVFNDVFQPGGLDIAIAQGNALSITHIFCGCSACIRRLLRGYVVPTGLNVFVDPDPGLRFAPCHQLQVDDIALRCDLGYEI